jgi:hypothetical protein
MSLVATDWTVTRSSGNIRYTGADHNGTSPSYATVIEFHRWLQGLADDAVAVGNDELDITNTLPSQRSTDNIITLINNYNIDDTAAEHLYDGSIIQNGGDDIYDGIVNFGNAGVLIQLIQNSAVLADDFWNYSEGGTHTGAANASILTDGTKTWNADEWIGYTIYNTTDTSWGIITDNDTTTITATLVGGTDNDWDASDAYLIGKGLNPDSTAGISHRFMVQVRSGGTDIDGRKLIGTSRRYGYTFSEFSINGTSRGNNVLALTDSADLNNTTSLGTVAGWTTIDNTTVGYNAMDVDDSGANEYYYSEWNKDTYTINQFYERMKYLSRDGSSETLYGLSGELFRGITHQVAIATPGTGTWVEPESLSWGTGATAGTGQLLAVDTTTATATTIMYIQLLTGVAPSSNLITGNGGATGTAGTVTERTISKPFCGASTGSAIIGAYGFGIEEADLSANDKVTDLSNTVITPPNNVVNTVSGLVSGEDRVLVAPRSGVDANGDPAINKAQMTIATTALTANNITSIEVNDINSTTMYPPSSGYIRVIDNSGFERRLHYSALNATTNVFTIDTTDGNEDFGTVNANIGNSVYFAYIDELASDTTATFTSVHSSGTLNLVIIVRDGGGTPIKQYIASWTQTSSNQTANVIRTSDT